MIDMNNLDKHLSISYTKENLDIWFKRITREVEEYNYFLPKNVSGDVCVDIGANLGAFTFKFVNSFNRLISIESAIGNINFLNNMIREKNINNVITLQKAVAAKNNNTVKLRPLMHNNYDSIGSLGNLSTQLHSFTSDEGWIDNDIYEVVETISLEGLFSTYNLKKIDLMKIDCEGAEFDLLYSKDLSNIKLIVMEVHSFLGKQKQNELIQNILQTHNIFKSSTDFKTDVNNNFTISFINKLCT
jgi:FkbM family methyltransferase